MLTNELKHKEKVMKSIFSSITLIAVAAATAGLSTQAMAEAPEIKATAPIIYLADNLDEADKLGWCIDTVGAGFNEKIHSHSCKPYSGDDTSARSNDIKFSFNVETGQIASHTFENKCVDLNDPENETVPFGLVDCTESESQKFVYAEDKGQLQLASDASRCVAVAPTSTSAGPFMSRSLMVKDCEGTDALYTTWLIKALPEAK
ncbi:hypothetical protein EOL70_19915 [Leucothrix sargassi]|nr:hypothetical protein EOL70_19915 [Leucothrix sargassi]